jgi:hypothetical protein
MATEVCPGCDHNMRSHFVSVTGEVICLVSHSGTSSSGVIGIPWTTHCDCVNHESPSTKERREHEAAERARSEAWIAEVRASLHGGMTESPWPNEP